MGRILGAALLALCLLTTSHPATVVAQDAPIEITYGDAVNGDITDDEFEVNYIFSGNEDDIVMIEMLRASSLIDPKLQLKSAVGDVLFENDDFLYPSAVIITSLRSDGEYTITATRYNGRDGESEGNYLLRLSLVEPTEFGTTIDTQIFPSNDIDETTLPQLVVLYPENEVTVSVNMEMGEGEAFAALHLVTPDTEAFGSYASLVEFNPGVPIYNLSFDIELQDEQIYVIYATRAFASYAFDAEPLDVSITVEEA